MLFLYLLSGLIGISNMILWGIYGDLLIESFSLKKIVRSLFFGILGAIYIYLVNNNLPIFIVALLVIAVERLFTEIYKALLREEKQNKYLIPSDLNIKFPPKVKNILGFFIILSILLIYKYINFDINNLYIILLAAFVASLGGMLKDAPYEGFHLLKFFRSPLVILFVSVFLLYFFPEVEDKHLLFALWGGERIISEFYKKILRGNIPGKFKRGFYHHIKHSWRRKRKFILAPYFLTLIMLFILAVYSVSK